jgi:ribosomal protein S18 acetylase RimI-like enzyme
MTSQYLVRRLRQNEGELYRKIRLASLADSPAALETTLESALQRTLKSWTEQANNTTSGCQRNTMLGFYEDLPVGLAALYQDRDVADVAHLIQVWVHPDHRGKELATGLMSQLFLWAKNCGYRKIIAEVNSENARAINFYQKQGFQLTEETRTLCCGRSSGKAKVLKMQV